MNIEVNWNDKKKKYCYNGIFMDYGTAISTFPEYKKQIRKHFYPMFNGASKYTFQYFGRTTDDNNPFFWIPTEQSETECYMPFNLEDFDKYCVTEYDNREENYKKGFFYSTNDNVFPVLSITLTKTDKELKSLTEEDANTYN